MSRYIHPQLEESEKYSYLLNWRPHVVPRPTLHNVIRWLFKYYSAQLSFLNQSGTILPKAKVGGGANSWRQKVETCLAGYNTWTCTCSWWCIVWFYKTDQNQHGTPVQRCLNAGAALKLIAVTTSAAGQRLAFTRPLFTLSMRAHWNE